MAAWSGFGANLSDGANTPERYSGNRMTANSFSLIGQAPMLGRDFTPGDERPEAASGSRQLAAGLALGLGAAIGTTRVLETLLVQVQPTDPLTFAAVAAMLTAAAVAACWLPVRRAQKVDPMVALRYE